jgi:hypothetical protein
MHSNPSFSAGSETRSLPVYREIEVSPQKEKGELGSPFLAFNEAVSAMLFSLVQFHGVAGVDVFKGEDDHG